MPSKRLKMRQMKTAFEKQLRSTPGQIVGSVQGRRLYCGSDKFCHRRDPPGQFSMRLEGNLLQIQRGDGCCFTLDLASHRADEYGRLMYSVHYVRPIDPEVHRLHDRKTEMPCCALISFNEDDIDGSTYFKMRIDAVSQELDEEAAVYLEAVFPCGQV